MEVCKYFLKIKNIKNNKMSSSTITVNSTWTQIFNIPLHGYYGLYLSEQAEDLCKGSIRFMENGNILSSEITISDFRGINILTYLNRVLPMSFHFENYPTRVYEIRKNGNYLEIRLTAGTDISVSFTLFSGLPDKSIVFPPRIANSTDATYTRLGTYVSPVMRNASATGISWMDNDGTSYDVRIFDKTNNLELLNVNLNNTIEQVNDFGSLSNIPADSVQIEIWVRINGGTALTNVFLESLTINYN